ncbi:MAG: TIGR04282 family arsenosugar biosynthesis glycosyltransferase [Bacteroidota bacterium]|nr:TIGR04282 family arsenosugar biosynthesis glycosyltransferase [Bacteroidota bacterium]
MKPALIIMVRNPVLGKVKSRLAASVGEERALQIYKYLLAYTHSQTRNLPLDKFVFYDQFIDTGDHWDNSRYRKRLQQGSALGEKMNYAFTEIFELGYGPVMMIGSDCPEISAKDILLGFESLVPNDFVLGPALDGGYYLIGMRTFYSQIMEHKKWGTSTVYQDTLEQIIAMHYTCHTLRVLGDVDEVGDLTRYELSDWDLG